MKGYIAVVTRIGDRYRAETLGIPACACEAATAEAAIHGAQQVFQRRIQELRRIGRLLPAPRPAPDLMIEVRRRRAVGGACFVPR
jgi:hypothetical protein